MFMALDISLLSKLYMSIVFRAWLALVRAFTLCLTLARTFLGPYRIPKTDLAALRTLVS